MPSRITPGEVTTNIFVTVLSHKQEDQPFGASETAQSPFMLLMPPTGNSGPQHLEGVPLYVRGISLPYLFCSYYQLPNTTPAITFGPPQAHSTKELPVILDLRTTELMEVDKAFVEAYYVFLAKKVPEIKTMYDCEQPDLKVLPAPTKAAEGKKIIPGFFGKKENKPTPPETP